MQSRRRRAGFGALVVALIAAPGLAMAAGMGGAGSTGGMSGSGLMGSGMNNIMNNMMMGSYGTTTGSAAVDPKHPDAPLDPSLRNFSHTGLTNPLHVSKAWQDLPVSDSSAAGALAPVPALPAAGGTQK
jgi:hypothetical protein